MSRHLAYLLDKPEILVESAVKELEHFSGWQSIDVRLLADINHKVRAKTKELGLDPDDTTGPELYHALLAKAEQDEQKLEHLSSEQLIKKIARAHRPYRVYALKHSVAKDVLRHHPPRRLMKHLHYRSIDSMLRRENIAELYTVLPAVESSRWLGVFWKDLAKLQPSDFDSHEIELINMPKERWDSLNQKLGVSNLALLGTVVVWPNVGSKMSLSVQVAQNISLLRAECAYIKHHQVEADFGKRLVDTLQNGLKEPLKVARMPISWVAIFRHYGKRHPSEHTEFFGPHLLHEDIKVHHPLHTLAKVSPVFAWWQGLEYVAKKAEKGVVSLNLADVLASRSKPYDQRNANYANESLWHEFIVRYLQHPAVEQRIMGQLEPQTIPIEDLKISPPGTAEKITKEMEVFA